MVWAHEPFGVREEGRQAEPAPTINFWFAIFDRQAGPAPKRSETRHLVSYQSEGSESGG